METKGRECVVTSRRSVSGRAVVLTVKMSHGPARSRRDSSTVTSVGFSHRGPGCASQHPHSGSGASVPLLASVRRKSRKKNKCLFFPRILRQFIITLSFYYCFLCMDFLKLYYLYVCVCVHVSMYLCVFMCAQGSQRRTSALPGLELSSVVSHLCECWGLSSGPLQK